jgi:phosphodiesterase/alkaline phosphatase D-like protein
VRIVNGAQSTWWRAQCDAWDGYTWTRDRVIARPTIAELEQAIREYVVGLDNHAHACGQPN